MSMAYSEPANRACATPPAANDGSSDPGRGTLVP